MTSTDEVQDKTQHKSEILDPLQYLKLPSETVEVPDNREATFDNTSASVSTHALEDAIAGEIGVNSPPGYGLFNFVVQNYWLVFSVISAIELLGIFLSYLFILQNPDDKLFPLDFEGVPAVLKTDKTYRRLKAGDFFAIDQRIYKREWYNIMKLPSSIPKSSLSVLYAGENVLTKECLNAIRDVERWLTDSNLWEKVALTDEDGVVLKPNSILRYFDGTYGTDLNDTEFVNIPKTLYAVYTNPDLKEGLEKLISNDAVISRTDAKSTLTRSVFTIGVFRHPEMPAINNFWEYSFEDKLHDLALRGRAGMTIYYFNRRMMFTELTNQVEKDILLAVGSFLFIVIFVFIQTQSVFITVFGIVSIILSFMWTNYIYRVLLGYTYFGIFHALSIFIILGIGTDDLFVFYDMWRATACMQVQSVERRFTFCYRHASTSMMLTSLTTAVAFMCNVFTPLYGISSFAVFTAILVVINYCSAVLFFPMCVLVYHHNLAWRPWPWQYFYPASATDETKRNQPNLVVKCFKGQFYLFVTHRFMKWVLIACCTGLGVIFAILASELEISERSIQFYRDGYNYQEATKLENYGFRRRLQDSRLKINIVFGVKEQDFSGCATHDYKCSGEFHYDDSLDLNPIPSQIALLKACHMLKNLEGHENLHLSRDKKTNQVEVVCFLDNMNDFFTKHGMDSSVFKPTVNLSLPVSAIKFLQIARLRRDLYGEDIFNANFYRFFETAVSYWLTNAYRGNYTGANYTEDVYLSRLLGLAYSEDMAPILNRVNDYYGTRLRYFIIVIQTSLIEGMTDFKTGLAAYEAWENFTNTWMALMPPSVQGFQTTSSDAWHTFKMSQEFQKSAITGIVFGTLLAFCVLTLATYNVITSFLATLNIILVVVTFAGCLKLFGIKISVIESINLSLVAGLSVDYVVHLSESYNHAPHDGRARKTRDMLEQMGVSILSGAITTSGAAVFMLQAQIYFFFQFGVFIMSTIVLSLFYSMFWFTPMLAVIGPEGNVGSLKPVFQWVKTILKPIQEELEAVDEEQKKISYSRSSVPVVQS
ncbi:hypothetical protein BsWGS_13107 [Bradybaena similaris]